MYRSTFWSIKSTLYKLSVILTQIDVNILGELDLKVK